MSDGSGIDWDALFPGVNKHSDKATEAVSYATLIAMYRTIRQQLDRDGATPQESVALARMLIEPVIARSIFQAFEASEE